LLLNNARIFYEQTTLLFFNKCIGTFNRNTKITKADIEDLMTLLESSDYHKKIQSNGFSE